MAAKKKGIGNPFAEFGSDDASTPVEQQASTPVSQLASKPVKQDTSRPVLKKFTYYLTVEQDNKLEDIRSARRKRGVHVDKSALVREAIDLLQENEEQPVTPAPVEQKPVIYERTVRSYAKGPAAPVGDPVVSLLDFADQHAVSRNESEKLWKMGMISGTRIVGKGVLLYQKGLHDFWVQFHETPGFRACDDCPHTK